jgi:hypothetical protein
MKKPRCHMMLALLGTLVGLSLAGGAAAAEFEVGRTADGHPDLQGVIANNSITPIERPRYFGNRELMTDEELEFLNGRLDEIYSNAGDALFGDSVLEAAFDGNESSRDTATGNYDQQWMVERTLQRRTSQIIDPPDGRFPPMTEAAIQAARELRDWREAHPADSWLDRSLSERCVHRGVPNLRAGYNSYWQIVQSRGHVAIIQEMFHDVRLIPLTDMAPLDEDIRLWNGSSRGYWEGDTLVVQTRNFNEKSDPGLQTADRVYEERFTRLSEDELQYDIRVHDPGTYTGDYTRRIIFSYSNDALYEYACHEGNYGMSNILAGHRVEEARQQEAALGAEEGQP